MEHDALAGTIAEDAAGYGDQLRTLLPANSKDRARLDDDLEQFRLVAGVSKQRTGDDQMAGAGNRKELGQALDNAEDRRGKQVRKNHAPHTKKAGQRVLPGR